MFFGWLNLKRRFSSWLGKIREEYILEINEEKRKKCLDTLQALKTIQPLAFEKYLEENNFKHSRDLFKKYCNYVSQPWITIYLKRGSCDDFAELWRFICCSNQCQKFSIFRHDRTYNTLICIRDENSDFFIINNTRIVYKIDVNSDEVKKCYGFVDNIERAIEVAVKKIYSDVSISHIAFVNARGLIEKLKPFC